nr:MAG TPA: hypothetical protein [Caudoviricetes sp.]
MFLLLKESPSVAPFLYPKQTRMRGGGAWPERQMPEWNRPEICS